MHGEHRLIELTVELVAEAGSMIGGIYLSATLLRNFRSSRYSMQFSDCDMFGLRKNRFFGYQSVMKSLELRLLSFVCIHSRMQVHCLP